MAKVIRTQLESSSLASVVYSPKERVLEVEFRKTGHFYQYLDVSREMYQAFMEAESKGAFLNQVIKPQCEHFRVEIPF